VDYPKRTSQHIKESRSFKALFKRLPDEWVPRHVTERDYGIDCVVEIPLGEDVVGWLFGAQLKSTRKIDWREDGTSIFSDLPCSAVNYWLGLPFPVFLFLYVEDEDKVFIANARQQARRRYGDLLSQKSISFRLHQKFNLEDKDGIDLLLMMFFQEQSFERFALALQSLLTSVESHSEFIERHWERDHFLEVSMEDLAYFTTFCECLAVVADFVAIRKSFDGAVPRISDLIEQDQSNFQHSSWLLHEATLARALRKVTRDYVQILELARHTVADVEFSYWFSRDRGLAIYCTNSDSEEVIAFAQKKIEAL
jgi:hypothetical protein